jgi:RNA polymerase sigma factor (sigma-70 family)
MVGRNPVAVSLEPVAHAADLPDFNSLIQKIGTHKDKQAFVEIFNYFAPRLKSFLMKGSLTPDQAEELVQETMISVWDKAQSFDPKFASASTWIFTIARNKKIDAFRKKARSQIDPNDPFFSIKEGEDISDAYDDRQQSLKIAQSLKKLPPEQADLIRKSFFEDLAHNEIAKQSKLPLGTVKSRIRLALERLRKDLNE